MTRRHTKRDLVRLFKERGLRANRLLGQNFLVDHNVLDFICRAAELSANDVVLEIGAGTGLLTRHIADTGARVVAVEIDPNLFAILSDYVGDCDNVRLLNCDVHGKRRRLDPKVIAALESATSEGGTVKVVCNLPYCISSDLLLSLLEMPCRPERMVLTVQKEFADRLLARPGSRAYGPLTVLLRAQGRVERLRDLAPSIFWPVPKVASSVVQIAPGERFDPGELRMLKSVVSVLFNQRRKTAAAALRSMTRPKLTRPAVDEVLRGSGVPDGARAEALSVAQLLALSRSVARVAGAAGPSPRAR